MRPKFIVCIPSASTRRIYKFLRETHNPFGMENLTYIREAAHSMKLNDLKDPAIIISASGMAEAGRIRHHLKNNIGNPDNLILFIGYCAEHTLGWQILQGRPVVNIFGEPHQVRAKIASVDAFSGHADQKRTPKIRRRSQRQHPKNCRRPRRRIPSPSLRRNPPPNQTESRSHRAHLPASDRFYALIEAGSLSAAFKLPRR
jgi:hypothetical protein